MPELFITCPVTEKPEPTQMNMPTNTSANNIIGANVRCNQCSQYHMWDGKDAYFLDENGQPGEKLK